MNIDKDQVLRLLQRQGRGDQANYARQQLPDTIDTSNPQHAALLVRYGIDPAALGGELGGPAKLPD